MNNDRRIAGKVLQWDYDVIESAGDQECCYSLTRRDVALIMAITEQMGWKTRYLSPTGSTLDTDKIDAWKSGLETRLMQGCCPDGTLSRFNDDGTFETSVDGGLTWQPDPAADPRNQATQMPPLDGEDGEGKKCAAADNGRDTMLAFKAQLRSLLEAGTTILAVVAGLIGALGLLLGLTVVASSISVLLFGLAAGLLTLTPELLDAALDEETMDLYRCILFCHVEENGQFTYDGWLAVLSDIDSIFTGFAQTFFHSIVAGMGYIGLTNSCSIGAATADDCGDCDCGEACAYKYDVRYPYSSPSHGTVLARTDTTIDLEIGSSGYGALLTADYNDCCTVSAIDVIAGTPTAAAHIPCGTPWSEGAYIFSSGLTASCATLLATGPAGSVIRYTFTP